VHSHFIDPLTPEQVAQLAGIGEAIVAALERAGSTRRD
jgi:hypothetical protein